MEANVYRNKINSYLQQLNEVNMSDASNILMWFYRAKDANVMFETYEVSDYIYNRLTSTGYEQINESESMDDIIKLINGSSENVNENVLARRIIAIILRKIRHHESLDLLTISLIEMYNETYNKEITFSYMMRRLHESVGSKVTFDVIRDGNFCLLRGALNEVDDYKSITVDGVKYPFIDVGEAIRRITASSGSVLFNNGSINTRTNLVDAEEVKKLSEETFKNKYGQDVPKVI